MTRDKKANRAYWIASAALLALMVAAGPAVAAAPAKIENIRVGFHNRAKPGSWTPVWVDLKGGIGRFQGILEVEVPDDDGTKTVFRREVDLASNAFETFSTYARFSSMNDKIVINLVQDRNLIDQKEHDLTGGATMSNQVMLITLGNPRGVSELSGTVDPNASVGSSREIEVVVAAPERLPDGVPARWYGYDGANVVVLDTNDQASLDALNTRGEALRRWVQNGGHLVVAVGSKWQAVQDGFLAEMLPAKPAGRMRLNDLGSLETFAGANSKPIVPAGGGAMEVTKLEPIKSRGGKPLDATAATPLIVRGYYGFGRVTVVGLDVDQKPFADWGSKKEFWTKVLDLRLRGDDVNTANPSGRFYNYGVSDISTNLHSGLQQFPGVRLVPFGWVAFFVFLYILLIGPGDYFFLKKVVKRMEMTWVTFPLIVVVVSLLAYVAAYQIKGTDLRVNKVDAVDVDQTNGLARGTSWVTVFSPENRDYDVAIGLPPTFTKTSSKTVAETIVTWFGAPENGFGGMGAANRMALSSIGYSYAPIGEPSSLQGVRMLIWSTKGIYGRWSGQGKKVIDSKLTPSGPDRLEGSITNLLDKPMKNTWLVWKTHVYALGQIDAGATKSIESNRPLLLSAEIERLKQHTAQATQNFGMAPAGQLQSPGISNLPNNVRAMMFNDSTPANTETVPSSMFHNLDLTGLANLDRPMIVADVDDSAATLSLGKVRNDPKITQTTVLRVILPTP